MHFAAVMESVRHLTEHPGRLPICSGMLWVTAPAMRETKKKRNFSCIFKIVISSIMDRILEFAVNFEVNQ